MGGKARRERERERERGGPNIIAPLHLLWRECTNTNKNVLALKSFFGTLNIALER